MEEHVHEKSEEAHEEMNVEEVAHHADDKVDALLELLIKKGVITEDEFNKEYDDLFEEEKE